MPLEQYLNRKEKLFVPTEMDFIGDEEVIYNIVHPSEHTITAILFAGGGQKGVLHGGIISAMEQLAIVENPDFYVGISTGVSAPYYGLAGKAAYGSAIFYRENVDNKLFNLWRYPMFDADTLEWVFREERSINYSYLKSRRPEFYAGVTTSNGDGKFLDMKSLEDPLVGFMASINIPVVNGRKKVIIDGEEYYDGSISNPLPISWIADELKISGKRITDILVVLTSPLSENGADFRQLARLAPWFNVPKAVVRQMRSASMRYTGELQYLLNPSLLPDVRIASFYPVQTQLKPTSINATLLKQGFEASQNLALTKFKFCL